MIIYDDDGIGHEVVPIKNVRDAIAEINKLQTYVFYSGDTKKVDLQEAMDILRKHIGEDL